MSPSQTQRKLQHVPFQQINDRVSVILWDMGEAASKRRLANLKAEIYALLVKRWALPNHEVARLAIQAHDRVAHPV